MARLNLLKDVITIKNFFIAKMQMSYGCYEEIFLQLAMDGPNVNWKIMEKLDDHGIAKDLSKTLKVGSCSQRRTVQWN